MDAFLKQRCDPKGIFLGKLPDTKFSDFSAAHLLDEEKHPLYARLFVVPVLRADPNVLCSEGLHSFVEILEPFVVLALHHRTENKREPLAS
ncbi:MAG: hypothetical protein ACNS63_10500, partial [Candidatus Nitrospinota bacterium M3_3B_026]